MIKILQQKEIKWYNFKLRFSCSLFLTNKILLMKSTVVTVIVMEGDCTRFKSLSNSFYSLTQGRTIAPL